MSDTRKRNTFFTIHDAATGLIFEALAPTEKEALDFGRFRHWAPGPRNVGLRRILLPTKPWPTLKEESNYFVVAREQAERTAQRTAADEVAQAARLVAIRARRAEREAAEEVAHAARAIKMRADQADRLVRRAALDARLGRTRPVLSAPVYDPDTDEWI